MKINTVLVSGSKGFIGKHLCRRLTEIGMNVVNSSKSDENNLDVTNMNQLQSIEKVEAIIHLAAKTSIKNSLDNPYETYRINLFGTLNLLEFARLRNISKFMYISSYVYGQPKYLPIDEKHPVNPHSPYNKSKLLAEQLCKNYSYDFGIDVVILRPFYLYGPESKSSYFIPSVIQQIMKNGKVLLSGENTKRDFLFIDDFINLLAIILNEFPSGYDLYNVGSGTSSTIKEITEIIAKLLKKKITISYDNDIRSNDVIDMTANISKVSNAFNWKPMIELNEGLKLTIENTLSY
jgi:nucleoside-diphosphate-sugar epimerase